MTFCSFLLSSPFVDVLFVYASEYAVITSFPGPGSENSEKGGQMPNTRLQSSPQKSLPWDPFLESPGNLAGPKSYFEIKVSRKVGCALTSNEVHFVSLADKFTVQISNLLKPPSGMEDKTP